MMGGVFDAITIGSNSNASGAQLSLLGFPKLRRVGRDMFLKKCHKFSFAIPLFEQVDLVVNENSIQDANS
jgi:hypothetical protein